MELKFIDGASRTFFFSWHSQYEACSGLRIWDLDLGPGLGTWIWDLDLGLGFGTGLGLDNLLQ